MAYWSGGPSGWSNDKGTRNTRHADDWVDYYAEIYTIGIPRHPAQMYEALYCLLLFVTLLSLWYFKRQYLKDGFIFSIFMIVLWSLRIIDEFFKENQVDWEADIPLNMGQWLSIPMIILGLIIFIKTFPSKKPN